MQTEKGNISPTLGSLIKNGLVTNFDRLSPDPDSEETEVSINLDLSTPPSPTPTQPKSTFQAKQVDRNYQVHVGPFNLFVDLYSLCFLQRENLT